MLCKGLYQAESELIWRPQDPFVYLSEVIEAPDLRQSLT
jgi:hypothetical protein